MLGEEINDISWVLGRTCMHWPHVTLGRRGMIIFFFGCTYTKTDYTQNPGTEQIERRLAYYKGQDLELIESGVLVSKWRC